jgi:hypothetical protein
LRGSGDVKTRDLVLLWARAAGMCSHPDCKERLVLEAPKDAAVAVGEAAHIVARAKGGPRGDSTWDSSRIHSYDNLILLCAHHHTVIDRLPVEYSAERIRIWKAEHEAWVDASTSRVTTPLPWTAIFQEDTARRIDVDDAIAAMGHGQRVFETLELRADIARQGWVAAAAHEARSVLALLASTPPERCRFSVFSLGRIPLAVQLGYVLGDRARVCLYHYDRDGGTWQWPDEKPGTTLTLRELPGSGAAASIRVSLSARVAREDAAPAAFDIEIAPPSPSVRWLRSADQLTELAQLYEQALARVRERGCERIHLYYAGPAAGAIAFGRAYNPRMNPPLELYEYRHGGRPCYEPVLSLNAS